MERNDTERGFRNVFSSAEAAILHRQLTEALQRTNHPHNSRFLSECKAGAASGSLTLSDKQYVYLRKLLLQTGTGDLDYLVNHGPEADLRKALGEEEIHIEAELAKPISAEANAFGSTMGRLLMRSHITTVRKGA